MPQLSPGQKAATEPPAAESSSKQHNALSQLSGKKSDQQLRGLEAFSQALRDGAFRSGTVPLPQGATGPSSSGGGAVLPLNDHLLRIVQLASSSSDPRVRQAACQALSACASDRRIVAKALSPTHVKAGFRANGTPSFQNGTITV